MTSVLIYDNIPNFEEWLVAIMDRWAEHERKNIEEGNNPLECMIPPVQWLRHRYGTHQTQGHKRKFLNAEISFNYHGRDRKTKFDPDTYVASVNWIRDHWNEDMT